MLKLLDKQLVLSKIKDCLRAWLRLFGYRITRIGPYEAFDFENFLYQYIEANNTLTFLQIGANDGVMNDPIYQFNCKNRYRVSGFVLEPLPDLFEKLCKNYEICPDIKAVNLAIHETEDVMTLHRVRQGYLGDLSELAQGVASFDPNHWKKTSLIPSEDYIDKVDVKCMSFRNFIKKFKVKKLDLLLIDTEGYDFEILNSIDFTQIKPNIIRFEHGVPNNVMSHEKFLLICNRLNIAGYQIVCESYDATAYLMTFDDIK